MTVLLGIAVVLANIMCLPGCKPSNRCDPFLSRLLNDVHDEAVVRDNDGHVVIIDASYQNLSSSDWGCIRSCAWLHTLEIEGANATDHELSSLQNLKHLKHIDADGTSIGDEGLRAIAANRGLVGLSLASTRVTDDGMRALAGHPSLMVLMIDGTQVTDVGLLCLKNVPNLRYVGALGTKITPAGAAHLQRQVPGVVVALGDLKGGDKGSGFGAAR